MSNLEVPYKKMATVMRIIDGDTLDVKADLGFDVEMTVRIRLISIFGGVDAYELRDRDPIRRSLALAGMARIAEICPPGTKVIIETIAYKHDGFKRYLSPIATEAVRDLGALLIAEGLAVPWVGMVPPPPNTERAAIHRALENYKRHP